MKFLGIHNWMKVGVFARGKNNYFVSGRSIEDVYASQVQVRDRYHGEDAKYALLTFRITNHTICMWHLAHSN